ncbi:XdhC family protein [Terasakiella sp. A23]|uniref:XdhC family protein n=1 Tax=Terasakiella sp. FCG-A23 TaxID=3080561 RepID=UPI002955412D|nr:XdhC family protein [Terasakiella sp. A23]MDV7341263.1 XdhC family protein [Terasakiella sp. A23]
MSNQLSSLLDEWAQASDKTDWVLGTVYKTEGSAYRKAGAMMLINGDGQQFGLLSGGCLEADIIRNARKVMMRGKSLTLVYDGTDEDDLSFQLGIGCGGKVYIMLQPVTAENDLGLSALRAALKDRKSGTYYQKVGEAEARFVEGEDHFLPNSVIEDDWLITSISPEPHLLVVGGGIDARPLVRMAKEMGWRVTLSDPRPANARAEYFPTADVILREIGGSLTQYIEAQKVDVAVLMSHNINLDAEGLKSFQKTALKHIALLGPKHRYHQVLERAGLSEMELTCPVSGPAGLDIGGQLPESIALSILAETHGVLHQKLSRPQLSLAAE